MKAKSRQVEPIGEAPRGAVVTVIGPPESGKSDLLWACYTSHEPRKLTVEVVPETVKRDPSARRTYGYDRTIAELRECAELQRWHVVATLERDEIERLFELLCPIERDGERQGFGRAIGGLTIACGELSYLAPRNLGDESAVRRAYLMYRHHWLSLHGAIQHAPDCFPAARLSADRVVFLRTTDDLGLDAIARASTKELARRVEQLDRYHSLTWVKSRGRGYVADERYRVYDVLDSRARSLSSDSATLTPALSAGAALSAGKDANARPTTRQRQARA